MSKAPVVAVINTSPDTVDMLRIAFEFEGFVVVSTMTFAVRDGHVNFDAFLAQHKPDVVLYDIALPYRSNWQLFVHLCETTRLKDLPIIITSSNAAQVRPLAAGQRIEEIVDKPVELRHLIACAREAARGAGGGERES